MSRSRKKEPVVKDPSNSNGKKIANRKLRRRVKDAIHHEKDGMPLLDEVMNAYDIVDFKSRARSKEDEVKMKRK